LPSAGDAPDTIVPQIVKAMRLQWRDGAGEAHIRLEPEHLGEVSVSLRVRNGTVTATLHAENPTVQIWIDARQQELRTALLHHGLRLDQFEVAVEPDGRRDPQHGQQPRRQPRPSKPTQGARFDIDV
jgi:flagellar hook-length control protein FliK